MTKLCCSSTSFLGGRYDWKRENDHNELVHGKPGEKLSICWKKKTPISSTGSNRGRCTQCDEGKQNLSGVTQKTTKYAKLNPFFGGSGSYRRSLARLDGHCRLGRGGCRGCQRRTGGKIFHCFHGLNFLQVQVAGAEVPVDVAKVWS